MTSQTSLAGEPAELAEQEQRIAALEQRVRQLEDRSAMAGSSVTRHASEQPMPALGDPIIATVAQITETLFPECRVEVETDVDPTELDFPFIVFKVSCGGKLEELIAKETDWGRRVRETVPEDSGHLRLMVFPVE